MKISYQRGERRISRTVELIDTFVTANPKNLIYTLKMNGKEYKILWYGEANSGYLTGKRKGLLWDNDAATIGTNVIIENFV